LTALHPVSIGYVTIIEGCWRARFAGKEIDTLRDSLWAVVSRFDVDQPD
jgi:hypothetical protein